MKSSRLIALILVIALGVLAWRVFRPEVPEPEEASVATEVAVRVGQLAQRTLYRYVAAYGVVEPEPAGNGQPGAGARLTPPAPGVVAEVKCAEGQAVEQGQVLVRLDTRPSDVQIQRALEQVAFARTQYERQRKLLAVDGTSQRLLLEARQALITASNELAAAQTQRALLEIQAPLAGVVARINARPGEGVDLTSVLVVMVDPERLILTTHVPAGDLANLRAGQPAEVLVKGQPLSSRGRVLFVSPQLDPETGTALARISLPKDAGLRAGQYVNLRIVSEELPDRLAAPVGSVVRTEEGDTVVARVAGGTAVQCPITAGVRDGDWIEIQGDGLKPGDTVVTVGAYGLPKETAIRVLGESQ